MRNSDYRRTVKSLLLMKRFLGLVEMTFGLVNASCSLPEWQAVKMTFFALCWVPQILQAQSTGLPRQPCNNIRRLTKTRDMSKFAHSCKNCEKLEKSQILLTMENSSVGAVRRGPNKELRKIASNII